ncbi:hypothetical protein M3Y97_00728000 [Aphelenchoides bicaudatus]|nr:hypothetical protein M3Y97_00728000 [Aphelenchoides bicaudatus]
MLVQSVLLSVCLLGTVFVSAFDSTEIRLLEWPRGAKTFTKRSDNDILDLGALGPLARFRKSENFGRMVRNQDMLKDPLIPVRKALLRSPKVSSTFLPTPSIRSMAVTLMRTTPPIEEEFG